MFLTKFIIFHDIVSFEDPSTVVLKNDPQSEFIWLLPHVNQWFWSKFPFFPSSVQNQANQLQWQHLVNLVASEHLNEVTEAQKTMWFVKSHAANFIISEGFNWYY